MLFSPQQITSLFPLILLSVPQEFFHSNRSPVFERESHVYRVLHRLNIHFTFKLIESCPHENPL